MNIGIDHGYYAIKTRHFSFPAGITAYSHEPYTLQNTLEYGGKFFVCGTGRQPILRNKMENENYYLLTLAAIAKEIQQRGAKTDCSVTIAAGLPLAGFGREKKSFREYLRPSSQPVSFQFEGVPYKVTIEDVKLYYVRFSTLKTLMEQGKITPEYSQQAKGIRMGYRQGRFSFRYKNFLGYRKGPDGEPEIVPEEAKIIRLIAQNYLNGDSLRTIKETLESIRLGCHAPDYRGAPSHAGAWLPARRWAGQGTRRRD